MLGLSESIVLFEKDLSKEFLQYYFRNCECKFIELVLLNQGVDI